MWAKLDDSLLDHRKIFDAGDRIGRNGPAIALGFYVAGILYANKHLTDGFLPTSVVSRLRHVDKPMLVAEAMVDAGFWERADGGFRIHDYHDHNPKADEYRADREHKHAVKSSAGRMGGLRSGEARRKQKGTSREPDA